VVEHDEETMRAADWLIDLGPGAGEHGGYVIASGTPEEVRRKVREYVQHGATCPILYPLGDDVHLMIDTFANGYSS